MDGKDILKDFRLCRLFKCGCLCTDDLSLVKGSPSIRRKFLDLELSKNLTNLCFLSY